MSTGNPTVSDFGATWRWETQTPIVPPAPVPHACPRCHASGWVDRNPDTGDQHVEFSPLPVWPCPTCEGTGVLWSPPATPTTPPRDTPGATKQEPRP